MENREHAGQHLVGGNVRVDDSAACLFSSALSFAA
jgi:hypothetical protein